MTDRRSYRSNGKFLITAEYLVMSGARALALPLNRGQDLNVFPGNSGILHWESHYETECWFSCDFDPADFGIRKTTDPSRAATLKKLLSEGCRLAGERPGSAGHVDKKSGFTVPSEGMRIITQLEFSIDWGMGSSSTLVSNIARLMDVDPYELYWRVHDGSAYDIACARADGPLVYRLAGGRPDVRPVDYHPPFSRGICFVYSGRKQSSYLSTSFFRKKGLAAPQHIRQAGQITDKLVSSRDQEEFNALIEEHESMMSDILGMPALAKSRYGDFRGSVKSLGAWGGDFFMASSTVGADYIRDYFGRKGHDVIFAYDELAL